MVQAEVRGLVVCELESKQCPRLLFSMLRLSFVGSESRNLFTCHIVLMCVARLHAICLESSLHDRLVMIMVPLNSHRLSDLSTAGTPSVVPCEPCHRSPRNPAVPASALVVFEEAVGLAVVGMSQDLDPDPDPDLALVVGRILVVACACAGLAADAGIGMMVAAVAGTEEVAAVVVVAGAAEDAAEEAARGDTVGTQEADLAVHRVMVHHQY